MSVDVKTRSETFVFLLVGGFIKCHVPAQLFEHSEFCAAHVIATL